MQESETLYHNDIFNTFRTKRVQMDEKIKVQVVASGDFNSDLSLVFRASDLAQSS